MINRYAHNGSVWVDIVSPTKEEVLRISDEFDIAQSVIHELISPSFKSRVDMHKEYIYMILHFPVFKHAQGEDTRQEVDFIIGKNFLITARYESIEAMERFAKVVEVNSILDRGFAEDCTGVMFFGIIKEIYQALFYELEHIEGWLNKIEQGIFSGKEKEMVIGLSQVSRKLINFRKATDFHSEILTSLDHFGGKLFGEHFSYHAQKVLDEYRKVANGLHSNMEFVNEREAASIPRQDLLVICTGCQGESRAALTRIARGVLRRVVRRVADRAGGPRVSDRRPPGNRPSASAAYPDCAGFAETGQSRSDRPCAALRPDGAGLWFRSRPPRSATPPSAPR